MKIIISLKMPVLLAMLTVAGVGCSGYSYQLDLTSVANVRNVKVQSVVKEGEIVLLSEIVNSAGQGLAGELIIGGINARRERKTEELVAPLRQSTKGVNFRSEFWGMLVPALTKNVWPHVSAIETLTSRLPVVADTTKSQGLIELETSFTLSPDALYLTVFTQYRFLTRGSTKATCIGTISYESQRLSEVEIKSAIEKWSANGAALYRAELLQGIEHNVKMITRSLLYMGHKTKKPSTDRFQVKPAETIPANRWPYRMTVNGHMGWLIERNAQRIIFQSEPGPFYSLPVSTVEIIPASNK